MDVAPLSFEQAVNQDMIMQDDTKEDQGNTTPRDLDALQDKVWANAGVIDDDVKDS
jgi:hypothetical protein